MKSNFPALKKKFKTVIIEVLIINNQNEDNNYCQIYIALLSHIIYSFDIIKSINKSKEPQSFLQFSKHPGQKIG